MTRSRKELEEKAEQLTKGVDRLADRNKESDCRRKFYGNTFSIGRFQVTRFGEYHKCSKPSFFKNLTGIGMKESEVQACQAEVYQRYTQCFKK